MKKIIFLYLVMVFLLVGSPMKDASKRFKAESHLQSTLHSSYVEKSLPNHFMDENKSPITSWKLIFDEAFLGKKEDVMRHWNLIDDPENFNGRKQYYSPSNIQIVNEHLEIMTRKQPYRNKQFTSGAMTTKDKFSFKYGKVEIKAKLPKGKGIFPAFWMLPANGDPYPEIDIMEFLGQQPNQIWNVEHFLKDSKHARQYKNIQTSFDFSEAYHVFGLEWSPSSVTWFLDGEPTFSTTEFSPNVDMYLYINTAVGGVWATDPDETNYFPQVMKLDYIRVYTKEREE